MMAVLCYNVNDTQIRERKNRQIRQDFMVLLSDFEVMFMRYHKKTESGIFVWIKNNKYIIHLPHPYITAPVWNNALNQPLIAGSILLKIFNMDFSYVELALEFLKEDIEDSSDSLEEKLLDILDNCRDSIASEMLKDSIFDYCIEEKDLHVFSELISTQVFDIINMPDGDFEKIFVDLIKIQMYSHQILDGNNISKECGLLIQEQMPQIHFHYKDGHLEQGYYVRSIFELFALDTYNYLKSPNKMCFCKLCNKYFIKNSRNTEAYCRYPNPSFEGKSCFDKHKEDPAYKDPISELVKKATNTQSKYSLEHECEGSHLTWYTWTKELKIRERKARLSGDTAPLNTFIKNTRFSKTGFSNMDYSKY